MLELSPSEKRILRPTSIAQVVGLCAAGALEVFIIWMAVRAHSQIVEASRPLHLTFRQAINFQPSAGRVLTENEASIVRLQPAFILPAFAGAILPIAFISMAAIRAASQKLLRKLAHRLEELGEVAPPNST